MIRHSYASLAAGRTGDVCKEVSAKCDEVGNLEAAAEDARSRGDERADDNPS